MPKIQNIKKGFHEIFGSFGFRVSNLFRASNFEFRVSNRAGFTPLEVLGRKILEIFYPHHNVSGNIIERSSGGIASSKNKRLLTGFTIIEIVVATGLFAVLSLAAVSIMIAVVKAQTHIQRIQSTIDNIRFSLELLTKEMRVGTGYRLVSPNECGDAGTDELNFVTSVPRPIPQRRYFIQGGRLMRITKASAIVSTDCSLAVPFTADEVRIDRFRVILRGVSSGSSDGQPWATFNLKITALDPKGVSDFSMDLQTSVVRRERDFP